jgi:hypothetical protein
MLYFLVLICKLLHLGLATAYTVSLLWVPWLLALAYGQVIPMWSCKPDPLLLVCTDVKPLLALDDLVHCTG